tara:strand:+ start:2561 stop:2716 length:156 start_codon:yes stop_codon:yes gene_type:complete
MKKRLIEQLRKEIQRVKLEIVMGDYNGHIMTEDYKKKLKVMEKELISLGND